MMISPGALIWRSQHGFQAGRNTLRAAQGHPMSKSMRLCYPTWHSTLSSSISRGTFIDIWCHYICPVNKTKPALFHHLVQNGIPSQWTTSHRPYMTLHIHKLVHAKKNYGVQKRILMESVRFEARNSNDNNSIRLNENIPEVNLKFLSQAKK